jgi:uncharacterized protein (UPF0548 family)
MFFAVRPSGDRIQRFLRESKDLPLSYGPIGLARASSDPRFCRDASTVVLGRGEAVFDAAWAALQKWRQFNFGWVALFANGPSTEIGTTVAVLIRHLGFWSLNGGRILYTLQDGERERRRGYAYGTLTNHAERGEEIFEVSMNRASGEVAYTIRAASRPRAAIVWCGYPVARVLQHRFRRASMAAMQSAIGNGQ